MTTVRRVCLIAPLAAALLLAPVTLTAGAGRTMPNSGNSSSCCGPCCADDSQPACCAASHDQSEHPPSVSTDPCESCPPGECTCHCCCGTAGLVLALQLHPVSGTAVAANGRCELVCDQLTARSDEPLLPPPIG